MKFKSILEKFNSDLWGHHIVLPDDVVQECRDLKIKRLICRINEQVEFHCALMPSGDGQWFININKELRTKLGLSEGSELQVEIWKDESKYGMPMPEEMAELLIQDPEADVIFHGLTAGKQRSLLYMINKLKSSENRLRKAVVIVDYLKSCQGNIEYKGLTEAFRQANWK